MNKLTYALYNDLFDVFVAELNRCSHVSSSLLYSVCRGHTDAYVAAVYYYQKWTTQELFKAMIQCLQYDMTNNLYFLLARNMHLLNHVDGAETLLSYAISHKIHGFTVNMLLALGANPNLANTMYIVAYNAYDDKPDLLKMLCAGGVITPDLMTRCPHNWHMLLYFSDRNMWTLHDSLVLAAMHYKKSRRSNCDKWIAFVHQTYKFDQLLTPVCRLTSLPRDLVTYIILPMIGAPRPKF